MTPASAHDWPEDFGHENGCYECHCAICGVEFDGHKRRVVCRVCAKKYEPTKPSLWDNLFDAAFGIKL